MASLEQFLGQQAEQQPVAEQVVELVIFTNTTPNGMVIEYSPAPRRFYRVNGVEVPSVTTILGVLDKPAMAWWGMKTGVEGVLELFNRGWLFDHGDGNLTDAARGPVDADDVVKFLTEQKLTVNHVRDRAGDRGTSVHAALEAWCLDGTVPFPELYPEEERPYIRALLAFLYDISPAVDRESIQAEVTVGSASHAFAGRYDLRLTLKTSVEAVTRVYPVRKDKREVIPGGTYLLDLKTSSGVYPSHALQLSAYEMASIECGYEPTDYRAVVHVTKDGKYEVVATDATFDEFLAVRASYDAVKRLK